jgi:hypothetical protein
MSSASRAKRKRKAAVKSAKRSRNNTWWYGLTAIILIAGVALVVYARANVPADVGPFVADSSKPPTDNVNVNSHWHAALGVYDCDHWVGDGSNGTGVWQWPAQVAGANGGQSPGRVGTQLYAGLHSHDDGIIHMEPATADESGRNATLGKYFDFGGWKLSSSGYDFLTGANEAKVSNGDKCAGQPATLSWAVAKFNGDPKKPQSFTLKSGNPASYKLYNDDVIVLAFGSNPKAASTVGNPPSLTNLPDAANRETNSAPTTVMPSPLPTATPTSKP